MDKNAIECWDKLKSRTSAGVEIHTVSIINKQPSWFHVISNTQQLTIRQAEKNHPSVNLKIPRSIIYKDFERVFPYYEPWKKGSNGVKRSYNHLTKLFIYICFNRFCL
jgi:hypothetical protein